MKMKKNKGNLKFEKEKKPIDQMRLQMSQNISLLMDQKKSYHP